MCPIKGLHKHVRQPVTFAEQSNIERHYGECKPHAFIFHFWLKFGIRPALSVISHVFIPLQEEPLEMSSLSKSIADIFAEESESDQTFYGFSDSEIGELWDLKVSRCSGRHC